LLSRESQILELVETLRRSPWVALDTEADSLHSYPEKLCLLQLSHAGGDVLVDPLGSAPLAPLLAHLAERELVLHGASFDLRLLRRTTGFVAKEIFDTELAARLVGRARVGLADLVSEILGVTLDKASQRANWSQRPLTPRMMEYALGDTRLLNPLREFLDAELARLGRKAWHRESCARLIAHSVPEAPDPERIWRTKGSADLAPRALAALRELWHWREEQALARNRPPYFVLSHEVLVELARRAGSGAPFEWPSAIAPEQRSALEEAMQRARALPEDALPRPDRPRRPPPLSEEVQRRFETIRQRRDRRAADLGIDPTLISARADLVALAEGWDQALGNMMAWQAELLRP
jgi:ribonuclease D